MNKVVLMGRLTRYSAGENALAIARYTLAVDRRFRRDGEASADFIPCVSFGRTAEFAEKYFRQGLKIAVTGRIQTGSYTNREQGFQRQLRSFPSTYKRSGGFHAEPGSCC